MKKFFFNIIESIPLSCFLIYVQVVDIKASHDWLTPYLIASFLGIIVTAYLLRQKIILNRLCLAINLYFLSGSLALIIEWSWLNQLYGQLRGLGMLYWILFVGGISSVFSAYGFLGIQHQKNSITKYYSALLLAASALALTIAIYFSGNKFWGEWFPFIFLFSTRSILQNLNTRLYNPSNTQSWQ